jgi:hypothetical protein
MAFSIHGGFVALVFIIGAASNMAEARCNKRFIRHTIRVQNCYRTILSVACMGTCTSYTRPSSDNPGSVERFCECCREGESEERRVTIPCRSHGNTGRTSITLPVMIPTSCICRPCSVLPDRIIPAEQNLFQHMGIKRSGSTMNISTSDSSQNFEKLRKVSKAISREENL